jgi:hypothetical protein
MQSNLALTFSFEKTENKPPVNARNTTENTVYSILDLLEAQKNNIPVVLDVSESTMKAKEKILKQLPNMYKNTRMTKYLIEHMPVSVKIEYKKIKGLILNIEKRISWYLDVPQENIKCLLISTKAKSAPIDLAGEDMSKHFFLYYAKVIITEGQTRNAIPIPLYDLNINVL